MNWRKREREVLKQLKPLVDAGDRGVALRIYQRLTTYRRNALKCIVCGGPILSRTGNPNKKFDSRLCFQIHRRNMNTKKLLAASFCMVAAALLVFAAPTPNTGSVRCSWSYDLASNPGVTNFIIYYGPTSGTYTNHVNAGTNLSVTISGLARGQTYFFSATAQALVSDIEYTAVFESDYSAEASKTIPNKPPKPTSFNVLLY